MTITVARGVQSRIREYTDGIVLMIKGASDRELAAKALRAAAKEIAQLDAGWTSVPGLSPLDTNSPQYVSEVLPSADGPFVMVDGGHVPYRVLRTIPDIIARHLEAAGVTEATIAWPPGGGPITDMFTVEFAKRPALGVALYLYPPPPLGWGRRSQVPDAWLDEAAAWVAAELGDGEPAHVDIIGIEFAFPPDEVSALLRQVKATGDQAVVVSGELGRRMRGASGWFIPDVPALTLGAGGPAMSDADLLATFWALVEVARRHAAEVGYAVATLEPSADVLHHSQPISEWRIEQYGTDGGGDMIGLCDEYVPDAYPYQVLGPGHVERLGGVPAGAQPLEAGRVELVLGDPGDWLVELPPQGWWDWMSGEPIPRRDPGIQKRVRQVLAPCLVPKGEVGRRVAERWAKHGGLPPGAIWPSGDEEEPA